MSSYYTGSETSAPAKAVEIQQVPRNRDPRYYTADPDLAAAVNVALILGKPLLLTGEPGTGKTELADHVAMALGLSSPERFDTKSTSQGSELFYRFDSLARFHSANMGKESSKRALDFVTFGALGKAILRTLPDSDALFSILGLSYPSSPANEAATKGEPRRTVVLIDEIDKAPRDFPNDLLDAIDNLRFSIRELEKEYVDELTRARGTTEISADEKLRPIVIITSNSEKNLPPPFLRRCVYFDIPFPKTKRLLAIVARRLSTTPEQERLTTRPDAEIAHSGSLEPENAKPLLRSAVTFFEKLRNLDLRKHPSTAELIDWMRYLLRDGARAGQEIKDIPELARKSLGCLVKAAEDMPAAMELAGKKPNDPGPP